MLRTGAGGEMIDDGERPGVDDIDPAGDQIGRINARQRVGHRRAEISGARLGIDVGRVDDRRRRGGRGRELERVGRAEFEGGAADKILRAVAALEHRMAELDAGLALEA